MAGYIEQSLQPGENVDLSGRVSRISAYHRAIITLVIGLIVLTLAGGQRNSPNGSLSAGSGALTSIAVLIIVVGVVGLLRGYFFVKGAEYAVTDRRVIGKYGVIRRAAVDVMLTQVSGVSVGQTLLGRTFNYGTVWIHAAGTRRQLIGVAKPLAFRAAVYRRLEESKLLKGTAAYTLNVSIAPNAGQFPPAPAQPTPFPPAP